MKILAFDTANNSSSVCLSHNQNILAYREELAPNKQAETILPMIEEVLEEAKCNYNDVDYLAVINGPGSFTGIRIGLAVAKGILFGTQIKGITVSNFELSWSRAINQVKNYDKIIILLNAYRDQLYIQVFNKSGNKDIPVLTSYDTAIQMLAQERGCIICSGSGLELIYNEVKHMKHITILPRFARLKALQICRYIADKLASEQSVNNVIEPLYIRAPDAKIKKHLGSVKEN